MTFSIAALNILLGYVYTSYGVMTAIEMKRGWRTFGFSHFGAAWIAMAFTCGPHHLVHGIHQMFEGHNAGPLDLIAVLVGLPFGATWFLLRVEAFTGGRGDRFVSGTPKWLAALVPLGVVYLALLGFGSVGPATPVRHYNAFGVLLNMALVGIYFTIGYFLLRTQLRNRDSLGGWSVSGVSLTAVFPTCGIMHAVYIVYALSGFYIFDWHMLVIDTLAVPSGLYFLLVVRALYRRALHDWNDSRRTWARSTVPA